MRELYTPSETPLQNNDWIKPINKGLTEAREHIREVQSALNNTESFLARTQGKRILKYHYRQAAGIFSYVD